MHLNTSKSDKKIIQKQDQYMNQHIKSWIQFRCNGWWILDRSFSMKVFFQNVIQKVDQKQDET